MGSRNKNMYNIIWAALFISLFIYLAVVIFIKASAEPPIGGSFIVFALAGAGGASLIASVVIFKINFSSDKIKSFSEFYQFTSYFQQKTVLSMALMVEIGALGILLKVLGFPLMYAIGFIIAGSAGMVIHRIQAEALWKSVVEDPVLMAKMKMMS